MEVVGFVICFESERKGFADEFNITIKEKDKLVLPFKKVSGWWCHLLIQGRIEEGIKGSILGMLLGVNI